jgi:hypothetical protein
MSRISRSGSPTAQSKCSGARAVVCMMAKL